MCVEGHERCALEVTVQWVGEESLLDDDAVHSTSAGRSSFRRASDASFAVELCSQCGEDRPGQLVKSLRTLVAGRRVEALAIPGAVAREILAAAQCDLDEVLSPRVLWGRQRSAVRKLADSLRRKTPRQAVPHCQIVRWFLTAVPQKHTKDKTPFGVIT